jgi:hypothetical protein
LSAGTNPVIVLLLWKTPLAISNALVTATLEEFPISCPLGPNHDVTTVSPLLTVDERVVVQERVTMLSLINRPVSMDTSTLGGGTIQE